MIWKAAFAISLSAATMLAAVVAHAQSGSLAERLTMDRVGAVQPGTYAAGDKIKFVIDTAGNNYLLRFDGDPEVFAVYVDRISLGGRLLKYDSGEIVARVSGWGGITLYTDGNPNGLPAVRAGDGNIAAPAPIGIDQVQAIAASEGERLAALRMKITFTADWSVLENNLAMRLVAVDAMENAARGIERFAKNGSAREQVAHHVNTVTLATSLKPTLSLDAKTLIVTFDPDRGYFGRASSRAIARALKIVLKNAKGGH
ncbi:MAG TPA: DUF4908 domain-containing protein [Rhizomicrobium sp.]